MAGGRLVEAAGAIVLRRPPGKQVQVLLIHRPSYNDWSLPKGKLDPDEYLAAAAVRETWEEAGLLLARKAPVRPSAGPWRPLPVPVAAPGRAGSFAGPSLTDGFSGS